jgi:hypothetical protein
MPENCTSIWENKCLEPQNSDERTGLWSCRKIWKNMGKIEKNEGEQIIQARNELIRKRIYTTQCQPALIFCNNSQNNGGPLTNSNIHAVDVVVTLPHHIINNNWTATPLNNLYNLDNPTKV